MHYDDQFQHDVNQLTAELDHDGNGVGGDDDQPAWHHHDHQPAGWHQHDNYSTHLHNDGGVDYIWPYLIHVDRPNADAG